MNKSVFYFAGWRGNIRETIAKGWWTLNTERTDAENIAPGPGERRPRTPDDDAESVSLLILFLNHSPEMIVFDGIHYNR